MISIFNSCIVVKAPERKVVLSGKKLTKYFPEDYSETDMEKVIEALLEQWKKRTEIRVVKIRQPEERRDTEV